EPGGGRGTGAADGEARREPPAGASRVRTGGGCVPRDSARRGRRGRAPGRPCGTRRTSREGECGQAARDVRTWREGIRSPTSSYKLLISPERVAFLCISLWITRLAYP